MTEIEIVNGAVIYWGQAAMVDRSGRLRKTVPIACPSCDSIRTVDAGSLRYQIANRNFTGRCRSCTPLLKREKAVAEYRKRGQQTLSDGTFVDWTTTEPPPKGINGRAFMVDVICHCGHRRPRQVGSLYRRGIIKKTICLACSAKKHSERMAKQLNPNFKRGFWITPQGYKLVVIPSHHPMIVMATNIRVNGSGQVLEHRLIMANHLERPLESWEQVHHLNNCKLDNRIVNLQLVTPKEHSAVTAMEREIKRLRKTIQNLMP